MTALNIALEAAEKDDIIVVDFDIRYVIYEKQFHVNFMQAEKIVEFSGAKIFFRTKDVKAFMSRLGKG
jgi:hypothetical protein